MNFFLREEDGKVLPVWCDFLFETGITMPELLNPDKRTIVALSLPTRAYAACFMACGILYKLATNTVMEYSLEDTINKLVPGNNVEYIARDGKKYTGIFSGIKNVSGEQFITIKAKVGKKNGCAEWKYMRIADAFKIQPVNGGVDITKNQRGTKIISNRDFLTCLLGESIATKYAMQTKLDIAIVGQINLLRHEANTNFILRDLDNDVPCKGNFSDLLRIKNFLADNTSYRTKIFKNTICNDDIDTDAKIILFDGSKAFINRHECCNKLNWLVVLDRTDTDYFNAVEILNTAYQTRRLDTNCHDFGLVPAGMTIQYFQEAI
jgi:hypothetical protein